MEIRGPLIGRAAELEAIEAALYGVADGGRAVLVSGTQGVGKTRILRTVAERARAAGRTVEFVAATRAGASIPFGPLSHLTSKDGRLAARLTGGEPKKDVLVAVDDAHLLDEASAAFVHHLVLHDVAAVVLTISLGKGHRVPDAIVALWKDELATCIDLKPLPDDATDQLLDHALPGHIAGLTRMRLRTLTGGNPLYLRELLIAGAESGALRWEEGLWCWSGPLRAAWRISELVGDHLDTGGPAARALLELVACGEPLPLTLLDHDADGLIAAETAGLVEVVMDGRRAMVRLSQPLYGEVLRAGLGQARARAVHRVLARRMAGRPLRRDDDVLRMASWQVAAGDDTEAPVLERAARLAVARHDPELAERLARRAADTRSPNGVLLLADILCELGRPEESASLLAAGPPAGLAAPQRARWLAVEAKTVFFGTGRPAAAARALAQARSTAPHAAMGLEALRAGMLLYQGRIDDALAVALPVSRGAVPAAARVRATTFAVLAYTLRGQAGQATLLAGEAARDDPYLEMARTVALLFGGRLTEAGQAAEHGYLGALTTANNTLVAAWATVRGLVARTRGDLPVAVSSLREAVSGTRPHDPDGLHRVQLSLLAGALAMTGDSEAAEWMRRADEWAGPAFELYVPLIELDRAWAATVSDPSRASALARRAAAVAGRTGQLAVEAVALHGAARFGAAREVRVRLRELAEGTGNPLIDLFAQHAAALAQADGKRLEAIADAFDDMGAPLPAAEALVAAANAYRSAGDPSRAAKALEHARACQRGCPNASTPGLSADVAADVLTPRERDIATLAARPMTSSDIAQRLHISTRTVNNHLGRVYAKLGIAGREELSGLLRGER